MTIPLLVIVALVLWYGTTIFLAYRNATAQNVGGGSQVLNQRQKQEGQINVLLIGIGGENHTAGNLADSIMVASIDTRSSTISLLSLPRDLYVAMPNGTKSRINAAHSQGESQSKQKGGGPNLLKQVVSDTLKVPIHYYVRVDFEGFKKIIDALGGITIDVKTAINDPLFPDDAMRGYETFTLTKGVHKMDGETALKYARSRKTSSDFARAERQQEIIVAIKDKILSAQVLANPSKVTNIISLLGQHILTDFNASEIQQLITMGKKFNDPEINTEVLGGTNNDLVTTARSPIGESIVVPRAGLNDFSQIQMFAHAYFASSVNATETPTIFLQNSGASKTIITNLTNELEWAGFKVTTGAEVADTKTVLYDATDGKKSNSKKYLEETYNLTAKRQLSDSTTEQYDYTFIVGTDYSPTALKTRLNNQAAQAPSYHLEDEGGSSSL